MNPEGRAFQILASSFFHAIQGVEPAKCVSRHLLKRGGNILVADGKGRELDLTPGKSGRFVLIATGKAARWLAEGALSVLKTNVSGVIASPEEVRIPRIESITASHPTPDEGSLQAGKRIHELVGSLGREDSLLYLISGGSSSMVVFPEEGVSLEEKVRTQDILMKKGASIFELNSLRSALSRVKGGKLARLLTTDRAAVLVLSDVPGNELSAVGSGPFFPPSGRPSPLEVAEKYGITDELSGAAKLLVTQPPEGEERGVKYPPHVIIGDNETAVGKAADYLKKKGYHVVIEPKPMRGDARVAGKSLAEKIVSHAEKFPRGNIALVGGGETVVTVKGRGRGGRNQELALSLAMRLSGRRGIYGLCAGTDGIDGNSPAAGGFFDGNLISRARRLGLDPTAFLEENDSYTFLEKMGYHFITGKTGTNVMDIFIILIEGPREETGL